MLVLGATTSWHCCFFRGFFCILLGPHFAVSRPLRRLQLASTFGVWRSLLISLLTWVRKYSSIPRKERIKAEVDTDGLYFPSLARAGSWGCSSCGTGPGHSLWCCHLRSSITRQVIIECIVRLFQVLRIWVIYRGGFSVTLNERYIWDQMRLFIVPAHRSLEVFITVIGLIEAEIGWDHNYSILPGWFLIGICAEGFCISIPPLFLVIILVMFSVSPWV